MKNAEQFLDSFVRAVLLDAVASAVPQTYERRAREFDAVGTAASANKAAACRCAAQFWRQYGPEILAEDLDNVMAEFPPGLSDAGSIRLGGAA